MGDKQHVLVLLNLCVEFISAGQFGEGDGGVGLLFSECLAEAIVAVVVAVEWEEVGDGDGFVGVLAGEVQDDVLGDAGS